VTARTSTGFPADLSPLTTGTSSKTSPTGNFCPGQTNKNGHLFGCFGSSACRTITENGAAAGLGRCI